MGTPVSFVVFHFNPLPPHGGRPPVSGLYDAFYGISIHSLRMEGDGTDQISRRIASYFNPLPPHGGRHALPVIIDQLMAFQSTPSAWRETSSWSFSTPTIWDFNPLPPHGGRPMLESQKRLTPRNFNPLPPHGGRHFLACTVNAICHFNPLPPHGGRLGNISSRPAVRLFQSTPSAWRETPYPG